jgi:hypothetical protein
MEYLPHTEDLVFQKISVWGEITTHKIKKNDLEAVDFSDTFG